MPTDVQLTGAGYPLHIRGKTFQARTLTDKDHAELNAYVQSELMQIARNTLNELMSEEERREQIAAALLAIGGLSWTSVEGNRVMGSLNGIVRLGWQMIKHFHPKVSPERFREYVVGEEGDSREEIQEAVDNIDETFLVLNTSFEKGAESEEDSAESNKSIESTE